MKQPITPQARLVELTTPLNAMQIAELQRKMNESQLLLPKEQLTTDGLFGRKSRQRFNELAPLFGLMQRQNTMPTYLDLLVISHPFASQIEQKHLDTDQYYGGYEYGGNALPSLKKGILLHHTVSGENPNDVRDYFNRNEGRVGTHFCIGGDNLAGDKKWDGKIIQLFPLMCWAHHINTYMFNEEHNKSVIGVEICRWGMLDKEHNAYFNKSKNPKSVPDYQVEILDKKFNGGQYFHKYSAAQARAVVELLCYLRDIFAFDYSKTNWDTFCKLNTDMVSLKTTVPLTAHTTRRRPKEKSDIYPAARMKVALEAVTQYTEVEAAISFFNNNIQ